MAARRRMFGLMTLVLTALCLVVFGYLGRGFFGGAVTIHELLSENKQLKKVIATLTEEEQMGYAKVVDQRTENGQLLTTLRFVETARNDKLKKILEKQYTVQGDVVHFDALIVKFTDEIVIDGKSRALYLWRRVYGEATAPQDGLPIEEHGAEPERYKDLFNALPLKHRQVFWSSVWDLANEPDRLRQYGIRAVYGNAVYTKLRPGLIYVFKISATGQVYPEVVPEM